MKIPALLFVTFGLAQLTPPPPPNRFAPTLWTFVDLKVEATGPTSARLAWMSRAGATHYVIQRDGGPVGEVAAGPSSLSFVDQGLTPGQRASYRVDAMERRAMAARTFSTAKTGTIQTPNFPLESTRSVTVVTSALEAPRELAVAITDAKARNVRVTWRPAPFATTTEILRDGAVVANVAAPPFDDLAVAAGTHRWSARTSFVATPGRPAIASATTSELTLRLKPFLILAAGDSIMWGQGLADTAKFTSLTRDWVRATLGIDVQLVSFAHSGAILMHTTGAPLPEVGRQEDTFDQTALITPGEMPNSYPTILHQLNVQAVTSLNGGDVDLLLLDGCINDVGVTTMLDPEKTPNDIQMLAQSKCGAMRQVLLRARALFPNAVIAVTGYYAIASPQSSLTGFGAVFTNMKGKPIPNPLLADAVLNAAAFESRSSTVLGTAVASAGKDVVFVSVPFQPANAFGSPSTWLWPIPDTSNPDEVFSARGTACASPLFFEKSIGVPTFTPTSFARNAAKAICPIAAMGHPNRAGARAYATAITNAIQQHLPRWRESYAQRR